MRASSPTRMTSASGCSRAQSTAPRTTSSGPWSPPIASTATRTASRRVRLQAAGDGLEIHRALLASSERGVSGQDALLGLRARLDAHGLAPLYQPQLGQAWWTRFCSWQCGHSSSWGSASA